MPYRAPGTPGKSRKQYLSGKPIRYYRPTGSPAIRTLIDEGFQAFNAARLGESCRIFTDKMLKKDHDTTIALTNRPTSIKSLEWERIHETLVETEFNVSETARRLGMHRRTLARKLGKQRVR